jgi:hypothetical protein
VYVWCTVHAKGSNALISSLLAQRKAELLTERVREGRVDSETSERIHDTLYVLSSFFGPDVKLSFYLNLVWAEPSHFSNWN